MDYMIIRAAHVVLQNQSIEVAVGLIPKHRETAPSNRAITNKKAPGFLAICSLLRCTYSCRVICDSDEPELEVPVSRTCCCRGDRWSTSHEHFFHSRTGGTFCQERTARQWPNALCGEEKLFAPCIKVLHGKGYMNLYKSFIHFIRFFVFFSFSPVLLRWFLLWCGASGCFVFLGFGASGGWSRVHQIKLDWSCLKAIFIEETCQVHTKQVGT